MKMRVMKMILCSKMMVIGLVLKKDAADDADVKDNYEDDNDDDEDGDGGVVDGGDDTNEDDCAYNDHDDLYFSNPSISKSVTSTIHVAIGTQVVTSAIRQRSVVSWMAKSHEKSGFPASWPPAVLGSQNIKRRQTYVFDMAAGKSRQG
ncbi:hypothetical protein ElyMa_002828600 [Elysia marginata]|uniref:Uncharacterized protein n=1 Tax=Elysia marginata TaxID=1093978 RepID=A0AAV4HS86_9GAST|nr:hypothetical protein ElyMa_002828600 [Elysia marginata]